MITNNVHTANNSPSFRANLCFKLAGIDSSRMKNIQRIFQEKTPELKDILYIHPAKDDEILEAISMAKTNEGASVSLTKPFTTIMETHSDDEIANKLIKILKGIKKLNKRENDLFKYAEGYDGLKEKQDRNLLIANNFRAKQNSVMAERFEYLAQCFSKKLKVIDDNINRVNSRFLDDLNKMAEGDADIQNLRYFM